MILVIALNAQQGQAASVDYSCWVATTGYRLWWVANQR